MKKVIRCELRNNNPVMFFLI